MSLVELARALGLGDEPSRIIAVLHELYDEIDREVGAKSSGVDLPCKAGCDACCHESVFLSAAEFFGVAAHLIEHRSTAERQRVIDRMKDLAVRFEDELDLLEELEPGAERDEVAARIRFRCPLLDDDGRCSIYPARELNARTFGQSWDGARDHAFGCVLTHDRLRVLPDRGPTLFDAREARRRLVERLPIGTDRVRVYPWWFARYGDLL